MKKYKYCKKDKKVCKYCEKIFHRKIGYGFDIWNSMKFCGVKNMIPEEVLA